MLVLGTVVVGAVVFVDDTVVVGIWLLDEDWFWVGIDPEASEVPL